MKAPSYQAFCSQVFDDSRCMLMTGCEATVVKKIGAFNAIGTMSLRPRMFPGKYYRNTGEEKNPGGYQMALTGSLSDMPFQLSLTNGQPLSFQLSVPIASDLTVSLVSKVSRSMDFAVHMNYASKFVASSISANVANRMSSSMIDFDTVYSPKPGFGVGMMISYPVNTTGRAISFVMNSVIRNMNTSCVFYKGSTSTTIGLAISKSIKEHTKVGTSIQIQPNLVSEWRLGFRRIFTFSELSACISSGGILQSFYQRTLKEGCIMTLSSYTDVKHKVVTMGMGITISE